MADDDDKTNGSEDEVQPQKAPKGAAVAVEEKKPQKDTLAAEPEKKPDKKGFWTWDRFIDLLKILATVYAACIGTIVTMQFNERQHELNRIEAIAKLLPSLAASEVEYAQPKKSASGGTSAPVAVVDPERGGNRLVRDGTMWAIFRTAQNKTMLRDLAALFPEDVYRVVGSIAAADALEDPEGVTALEVASEKLAARYSAEGNQGLAGRLYDQALRLKRVEDGESKEPLDIIDLTNLEHLAVPSNIENPQAENDQTVDMMQSAIKLAEAHMVESKTLHGVNTNHSDAKTFYMHAIDAGMHDKSPAAQKELVRAYQGLGRIFMMEKNMPYAVRFTRLALQTEESVAGPNAHQVGDLCVELAELIRQENPNSKEAQQLLARSQDILAKTQK